MTSKRDSATHQANSAEEAELDEFLADDEEYNMTDEPLPHGQATSRQEYFIP